MKGPNLAVHHKLGDATKAGRSRAWQQLQDVTPNTDETLRGVGTGSPRPPPPLGSGLAPFHIPRLGACSQCSSPSWVLQRLRGATGEWGAQSSELGARSWSRRYRAAGQELPGVHLRRSGHRGNDCREKQGGGAEGDPKVTRPSHTWGDGGPDLGDPSRVGLDPQIQSALRGVLVIEVTCPPVSCWSGHHILSDGATDLQGTGWEGQCQDTSLPLGQATRQAPTDGPAATGTQGPPSLEPTLYPILTCRQVGVGSGAMLCRL